MAKENLNPSRIKWRDIGVGMAFGGVVAFASIAAWELGIFYTLAEPIPAIGNMPNPDFFNQLIYQSMLDQMTPYVGTVGYIVGHTSGFTASLLSRKYSRENLVNNNI